MFNFTKYFSNSIGFNFNFTKYFSNTGFNFNISKMNFQWAIQFQYFQLKFTILIPISIFQFFMLQYQCQFNLNILRYFSILISILIWLHMPGDRFEQIMGYFWQNDPPKSAPFCPKPPFFPNLPHLSNHCLCRWTSHRRQYFKSLIYNVGINFNY